MNAKNITLALAICLCLGVLGAFADVPHYINFQGTLTDSVGNPITATLSMQFSLYVDSTGGSSLWSETHSIINVRDGLFQVILGSNTSLLDSIFSGRVLWLEIRAQSETLSPREKIVAVPYSFKSKTSDHATLTDSAWFATYSDTADWALGAPTTTHVDTADYAFQAGQAHSADSALSSTYSDTSNWALGFETITRVDSANYALQAEASFQADSALHATYSDTCDWALGHPEITRVDTADYAWQAKASFRADSSSHSNRSDTAGFAMSAPPDNDWIASGDSLYHLNGNVGIGTSTPNRKLHIKGDSESHDACLHLEARWNPEIFMDKGGYDADSKIHFQSQGIPWWTFYHDGSEDALKFLHDGSAVVMTLSGDDKVGIGTMTPEEKLDVIGTIQTTGLKMSTNAGEGKVLTSNSDGVGTWRTLATKVSGTGSTGHLAKFSDSTTIANSIVFDNGSNIGIGTTNPAQKLDVAGTVKMTGFLMPTGASSSYILTSDASGVGTWQVGMSSAGLANYLPLFISPYSLGNSTIYQSSTNIGIGNTAPSHKLTIQNSAADDVLRLIGPDTGLGYGARLNFGDGDFVYLDEDVDDALTIYGAGRTAIMGGYVGIGTISPTEQLHVNGNILCNAINTGLGVTEVYPMNQYVRTTDAVTFATVNTGLGNYELYAMNQNVQTTDAVTFATINTGLGATEVYLMNQNVRNTDAVTFTTVNTGLGNYELYAMNQNVQTTDNPTFNREYLSDYGYALGGYHVGGTSDPGDDNLIVDGNTSMGTTFTTHRLVVANTALDDVLRLIGPDGTSIGYGAKLNFGDADYVYLDEDTDDHLYVYAANGTALMGGYVGVNTTAPAYPLDVAGNCHASSFPTSSDARLKTNVQQLTGVLDKVEKLRGVSFDWNSTYEAMGRSTGHREIGVIAQEVEAQFPELVTTWGDQNYRAVDYGRLTAVLIEAVKELRAQNSELSQQNLELTRRVETLERVMK